MVVPRVTLDGVTRTVGDLVFTNRQVFLARRMGRADSARVPDVASATPRRNPGHELSRPSLTRGSPGPGPAPGEDTRDSIK